MNKRWFCKVGLHVWVQSRGITIYDAFPPLGDRAWVSPSRECSRCGELQYWLPGYGGSEIGCWSTVNQQEVLD